MDAVPSPEKSPLRAKLLTARRAVPEQVRADEAAAIGSALVSWVRGRAATVAAYVPVGAEPGSPAMLDALHAAGIRVLLPVVPDPTPQPLLWAQYVPGELTKAEFGLWEPAGPRLPAAAIAEAAVLVVPALAVDRRGTRLGRGAGFYDRSLPLRDPAAVLIAVVRDDEVVDELPACPHDVPVSHMLTPARGVQQL